MTSAASYCWPEGVPRDYDELARDWGPYIQKRVIGYNKVGRNLEDLYQYIWMQLVNSDVLAKFVARANSTMAPTMTAAEAQGFLGVTDKQWENMLRRGHADEDKWAPTPLEGALYSRTAIFSTEEILIIDEIDPWRSRPNPRVLPTITAKGFRSYLSTAIHNHFANWCRTSKRKNQENLLVPTAVLAKTDDGMWYKATEVAEYSSWEATLVGETFSEGEIADAIDFKDRLRRAFAREKSLDFDALMDLTKKGRATPAAQRGLEVLDFIAQGYTIREAIKAQVRSEARQRQKVRASHG